jgi:voltage-gated potassium channel
VRIKPSWRQLENGRVVHSYEWLILVATLALIPVLVIETDVHSHGWQIVAQVCNWVIWTLFVTEVVFVLTVAPRKRAAARAHWIDIALVAITIPVLGTFLSAFRTVRLFRLFRLLRLGLLLSRAVQAERTLSRRQIVRAIGIVVVFVVVIAGAVESSVDKTDFHSTWDGIWWAIVTVTTVGYGDISPRTTEGRWIAIVVMVVGIAFLAVLTAAIASHFVGNDAAVDSEADADRDTTIALRLDQAVIEISQEMSKLDDRLARIEQGIGRLS